MWSQQPDSPKTTSQKNEKRLAGEIGFKLTPGSGNQVWPKGKGDGCLSDFMFELKETQGSSLSINSQVIGKLYREAHDVGREPVLVLSAYGIPSPLPKEWVAVPTGLFKEMLKAYLEVRDGSL